MTGDETIVEDPTLEEVEYKDVTSLADINTAAGRAPDPIILTWSAGGEKYKLVVKARWPSDPDTFGIEYLGEQNLAGEPDYDKDGKATFPHAGAHDLYLRQKLVASPTFLHNKTAFREFANKVPPTIVAALHRKLRLVGGLDADFFTDFQDFTAPAIQRMLSIESLKDSESSPTKSKTAVAAKTEASTGSASPITPTGTASAGTKSEPTGSSTTSGSPPQPTPTVTPTLQPRHTQSTA